MRSVTCLSPVHHLLVLDGWRAGSNEPPGERVGEHRVEVQWPASGEGRLGVLGLRTEEGAHLVIDGPEPQVIGAGDVADGSGDEQCVAAAWCSWACGVAERDESSGWVELPELGFASALVEAE